MGLLRVKKVQSCIFYSTKQDHSSMCSTYIKALSNAIAAHYMETISSTRISEYHKATYIYTPSHIKSAIHELVHYEIYYPLPCIESQYTILKHA